MRTMILLVLLLLTVGILLEDKPEAASVAIPYCDEVKNEHYSGPCVALMIDGVITGDETQTR